MRNNFFKKIFLISLSIFLEIIPEYPDDEEYDTDPTSDLIEYSIPDNINENTMIGKKIVCMIS